MKSEMLHAAKRELGIPISKLNNVGLIGWLEEKREFQLKWEAQLRFREAEFKLRKSQFDEVVKIANKKIKLEWAALDEKHSQLNRRSNMLTARLNHILAEERKLEERTKEFVWRAHAISRQNPSFAAEISNCTTLYEFAA